MLRVELTYIFFFIILPPFKSGVKAGGDNRGVTSGVVMASDKYPMIGLYDPMEPLQDTANELLAHELIKCRGNKAQAYRNIFNDGQPLERKKANAPYLRFAGNKIKARYSYLLDQYLDGVGLDSKSLLMKSAKLVDKAVKDNDITGFSQMVNTIMKLKGENVTKIAQITKVEVSQKDLDTISDLFNEM